MKLRAKLLFTILIASFLVILLIVVVPYYLVKKTVSESTKKTEQLLDAQQKENLISRLDWFSEELQLRQELIQANLLRLHLESGNKQLQFSSNMNRTEKLNVAVKLLTYNPTISMVQLYSSDQVDVITFDDSYLHQGVIVPSDNKHVMINAPEIDRRFYAISLKDQIHSSDAERFYALLDVDAMEEEKALLSKEIEALKNKNAVEEKWLGVGKNSAFKEENFAKKNELIEKLTPFYAEGLLQKKDGDLISPTGLFRLEEDNRGIFILTEQIYSTSPIFKPTHSFENDSYAKGQIIQDKNGVVYIVYSTLIDKTIISLGSQLGPLTQEFATSSHNTVLIGANGSWIGYDQKGQSLKPFFVQEMITRLSPQKEGSFDWNHDKYQYFQYQNEELGFHLVIIFPPKKNRLILQMFYQLEDHLSMQLLHQMITVGVIILLILLIFFWHFSHSFVSPIRVLANATRLLAKGHLKEITIPELGKRKDEVAELATGFKNMVEQLRDREKIRAVLDKVVSKDIAEEILRGQVQLGGEDRIVTMLFCDVRDFTMQTSNLPPQETIQLLNFYMTRMSQIIEGEGGLIDKYIGDEVMALYGAPVVCENHAMRAIASGMLIIKTLEHLKELKKSKNEIALEVGIGIHTGLVVAGNMGAENRLNYTVLGSNVNLAARLCQVAKANQLLISEHTLNENDVRDSFEVKAMEPIKLKGFVEPVNVYEVVGFAWNK